jgi:hypothetical protein
MFDAEAQARASRAALKVIGFAGVSNASPLLLSCSRHVCILLPDLSLVARISPATAENVAVGTRELLVTRYLLEKGAPVVGPSEMMPSKPFIEDGLAITFWPHVAHVKAEDDDDAALSAAAHAHRRVHDALADYPGELPLDSKKIEPCAALLRDPSALPALAAEDRIFLMRAYERLRGSLASLSVRLSPIHGDAHMGNVFITPIGPLWTDFEAICLGPTEWDVAGVPHLPAFPLLDAQLYEVMSDLRSLCVTVWCSVLAADPDKRAAAEYHLSRLRNERAGRAKTRPLPSRAAPR